MYKEKLPNVFAVLALPVVVMLIAEPDPVKIELPLPTKNLLVILAVEPFIEKLAAPYAAPSGSLLVLSEPRTNRSVKVCGIEVKLIEAAAVASILVSISCIVII